MTCVCNFINSTNQNIGCIIFLFGIALALSGRALVRGLRDTDGTREFTKTKKSLGRILMVVGLLIAGASVLGSLVFLSEILEPDGDGSLFGYILMFCGIPFAIGLGFFFDGSALVRSAMDNAPENRIEDKDGAR